MSQLKSYTVTFLDTLRIEVEVEAENPNHAHSLALDHWSVSLWAKADPALKDTPCTIAESTQKALLEVEENESPQTSESQSQ
ncbi:hypothetical protein [Hyphomicrobium sp. CS1BSMeth3]|uniref:DpnD/PcfM family protein n=1 Tax=Hyphomicrobium sp. CS1BSMeth3 TaxID=1892844 RepID=UPI00092FEDE8|nr:hypothetical protein [Hyphomicrobium sp. CS1BSMeth3]